ncbi:putative TrkA family protein [Stappia aggregata IAM 12614]|uniref:Putative TrkA family protein n=1 Tax=Roseibium aggregatum (strain ATCC 25650 / DSM 13394 / JCM 20685 / NBRC 16684 / NCIMB 2208 / IAM 12614 / B1) TaxID=384765 RepID=A0NN28_ROSAI|nr:monovalent cation:proton antiporter-2 (CPA2) family protein [Roseibium aggregatum]EAV45559.1 putative TrkA family protein [Stappia aggregata IAM 12614] [Roseibium aggregatum IAM 12614]
MALLSEAFVYLCAAVIAVPIANRLGLGSVLGYLIAGVVIGPVIGIVGSEAADVQHFAEFGVVMMLFLVGLELRPAMLWKMRQQLIGLGGLQVVGTALAFAGAGLAFGLQWQNALALGMILSLSSTAIVLQTLNEKGWLKTQGGQSSFSVLLTQDIAVIPMLVVLPLLALGGHGGGAAAEDHGQSAGHGGEALAALPGWAQALIILAVIAAIILTGRHLLRPVFRFIAEARLREIFTATALLLVIGIALVMDFVGLSPALGTFLAGVVLSDSDYRHELESDIEPFKGLLLGLFFLTVGAGIDFGLLFGAPLTILGLALGLIAVKFVVLFLLGALFRLQGPDLWLFALGLAQAGEFAFVLFGFASGSGVLEPALIQTMTLVVAVSMLLTPALFIFYEKIVAPRAFAKTDREPDVIDRRGRVVVAGMGRFGQIVSRLLLTSGYDVIILDHDPQTIENLRRIGIQTFYGDATRPDLLHGAGLDDADLFIAALDDRDKQTKLVEHVARTYPKVRILARARDRHHVYELENAGAHFAEREVFEGALALSRQALIELGFHPFRARTKTREFRHHDIAMLDDLRGNFNDGGVDTSYIDAMRAHSETLFEIMQVDRGGDRTEGMERGWTPPPKGDQTL